MFDSIRGIYTLLRRPNIEDIDVMARWMNDAYLNSTVFDQASFAGGAEQQAMNWLEENAAVYGGDNLVLLACAMNSGQPIGMVWFSNIDWRSRTADLRYLVGEPEYRTSLFGPEIALLSLQLAFHTLNLHKLYGYVLSSNVDSIKLADFGAVKEGILEHYLYTGGSWNDYHMYAMFSEGFQRFLEENRQGVLRRHYRAGLIK